ncbi:MAG: VWA domain-containing protein [Phycisphaerae bacterium]|nr:VWA domain-containing protein [Phycisphaerae bacterium]
MNLSWLQFDSLRLWPLIWVAVLVGAIGLFGLLRRLCDLRRFADAALLPRLSPRGITLRRGVQLALQFGSLALLSIALLGPRWGESTERVFTRNIDVMVLLDVSRSMLARDIAPNRLERAKLAIVEDLIPALAGDRVGVMAFAGVPRLVCPLTDDYGFLRLAAAEIDPLSSPRGGTCIGDAIREGAKALITQLDTHKVLLLITDGEDHECFPVEAAQGVWKDHEIPVIAVALGDEREGSRVPVSTENAGKFLEHEGQTVWSKANFDDLRKIAAVSNLNAFVPVGTRNFNLGDVYRERIVPALRAKETARDASNVTPARFHWFALPALALLLLEALLRESSLPAHRALRSAADDAVVARRKRSPRVVSAVGAAALLALAIAPGARGEDARSALKTGNSAYEAGDYDGASAKFEAAQSAAGDARVAAAARFNRASALFRLGRYADAKDLWVQCLQDADATHEARVRYNLGNCDYQEALALLRPPAPTSQDVVATIGEGEQKGPSLEAIDEHLDRAIEQYRDVIRLDAGHANARANLELARKLKRELKEQSTSQPSSQPQQQQQNQNDNSSQEDNQNGQQQNSNGGKQDQQNANSDSQNSNGSEQQQSQQNDTGNENGDQQQDQQSQSGQPNGNENRNQNSPANANGSEQCETGDSENGNADKAPQPQPGEEQNEQQNGNGNANSSSPVDSKDFQKKDASQSPEAGEPSEAKEQVLTPQETQRLLQLIRDREKARREAIRQSQRMRQPPVKKDW